jgi:hypothetical protein
VDHLLVIGSRSYTHPTLHGGEEQEIGDTEEHERQNHIHEFHSDDSFGRSIIQRDATAMPERTNRSAQESREFVISVVRRFLSIAEISLSFFARRRKL